MDPIHKPQANSNKTALFFVVKLLVLYLIFSQTNILMNGVFTEGGIYNAFLSEHFNYVQGLKTALIVPAVWVIKLCGFYAIHNQSDVMVVNGPYLQVNYDCLGLGVMSFLAAFVIAFPATLKAKFRLLIFGLVLIYSLNILRIAGLGILLSVFSSQQQNFVYHHEIFNVFLYLCLFLMIFFWIRKNTQPPHPTSLKH